MNSSVVLPLFLLLTILYLSLLWWAMKVETKQSRQRYHVTYY